MTTSYEVYAEVFGETEIAMALYGLPDERKESVDIAGLSIEQLVALVANATRAGNLYSELGFSGEYYIKTYNGKTYVIFKGYAGMRNILRGTRYLASNPSVVRLGIGPVGTTSSLKFNAVLSLVLYATDVMTKGMAGDLPTLTEITGGLFQTGADFVLSSMASAIVGAAIGTVTAAAFPAFLGGVVAGSAVSYFFNSAVKEHTATKNFLKLSSSVMGDVSRTFSCKDLGTSAPGCTVISVTSNEESSDGLNYRSEVHDESDRLEDSGLQFDWPMNWNEPDSNDWCPVAFGDTTDPADKFSLFVPKDRETEQPLGPTNADKSEDEEYKLKLGTSP